MSKYNFKVVYPKGFLELTTASSTRNPLSLEQYNRTYNITSNIKTKVSNNVAEEIVTVSLEELFIVFKKIIKKYKETENSFLAINEIYNDLTKEISNEITKKTMTTELSLILTNVLKNLDGTKGRHLNIPNRGYCDRYVPILKDTKKQLLSLFNKFLKCPDTDVIMFEDKILFIQLFAIIVYSFQYKTGGSGVLCTNSINMITLLELLLKKEYKPILESALNNMLSSNPLPFSTLEKNLETDNDSDSGSDDEWDRDDFVPYLSPEQKAKLNQKLISEQTPNPIPDPVPEPVTTSIPLPNPEVIIECCNKIDIEDEPENWDD
jgi:hypothetical protein